ncbi:ATP-binding cassette domain-containing protein [Candidatus Bathyarchaeota archaeon]|nr:ATP-binding cassette domain-containing protein [Candidatus Bathyarchaeota archaeon]
MNGPFDMGVYGWLNRLFMRGYSTVLSMKNLYPLDSNMTTEALYPKLERQLQSPGYRSGNFSLAKALGKALLAPWLLPIAPRVCAIGFKFAQPLFLESLLTYLQSPSDSETTKRNVGYGFIGAAALIYLGIAASNSYHHYYKFRAIYMIRSCLASALYKKSTEVRSAGSDASALTLMSTDIERIVRGFTAIHELWSCIIEIAIACWLLHGHLGAAFAAPIVTIFVCAGTISLVSSFSAARQRDWMKRIEKRVGMTARAIGDIKGLKIAGVVDRVYDTIQAVRAEEIGYGNRFRILIIVTAIFAMAPEALSPLFTFAVTSRELSTTTIYTSMAYIMLVTSPLSMILQSIPNLVAGFACLGRIQEYLEAEPRVDYRKFAYARHPANKPATPSAEGFADVSEKSTSETKPPDSDGWVEVGTDDSSTPSVAVRLSKCNFGWTTEKMSLKDISATIPAGQLSMIVGPVASGKSTFCHALLGEVPYASGELNLYTRSEGIGFCGQTPFLLNATLQENIIGFSPFEQAKYDEIIKATRLDTDVSLMPSGHHTNIGSNGIILSGGQKQRVSLARALYLGTDMVILDDILSGLDNDTETEVFARVFSPEGILRRRGTTVVICTHSIRHLPAADHIIALGSDGTLVEEGSFDDLMQNNMYVQSLGVKASSSSSSTASSKEEKDEPSIQTASPAAKPAANVLEEKFDKARQQGDWKVYAHYFRSVSKFILLFVLAVGILLGFGDNFSTVWLGFWSEDRFSRPNSFYIGIFGLFRVAHLVWILLGCGTILLTLVSLTGTTLHSDALRTVITAPLGFFTSTDVGVVTNLFSQDMTIIDGELPMALLNMLIIPFILVGRMFVIAVATPYLACSYVVLVGVLYMVQKFYLRTSRQVRLLDLEAKSPL